MNVVNASDSNSEFHSTSPLNSALTISPIAAARSGQLSSVQKPKNEVQPKSGFGKFSLGSLFKISNRGIIEPKSTAKQSREKKTSLTSQTPPLIEWPTRKSPPQHCSTNGVFQPIDFHQNTLRVPPSPLNLSDLTTLSPTIDQNHNDCKSNFVTIPTTPSSSSPVDDTKIVNIGIDSDGKVSEPARTSPEGQLLPFGRPLPVPRQRPPVVPRLFNPPKVSSDDFTIDNGSPKTVAKSADSTGSLNKLSPETPTEKLIPKLNNVFAFHESSSCSSDLENRTDLESSDKVVNENCNNQPRNASPTSNVSKPLLLGKIAQPAYMKELKFHPVMNSQKTDTNREPKVPEGQSTVGESRNTNDEERVNGNLYTSNPKLMKLISSKVFMNFTQRSLILY